MKRVAAVSYFLIGLLAGRSLMLHAGVPPPITREPVPQVAVAGSRVTLIGATSDVLANRLYWEKDGQPVPGANDATLVLRDVQASDAGDYQFIAANQRVVPGAPPLGESATRSARLDVITPAWAAGQLVQRFSDSAALGMNARAVLALPDGGCLLGGEEQTGGRHLVRLDASGQIEESFSPAGPNARIRCLAVHGDGFLVGGDFATYAGVTLARLARIRQNGQLDPDFRPPVLSATVRALAVQRVNGEDRILTGLAAGPWLMRLRADGRVDSSFVTPPLNGRVSAITLQEDGRILIGGLFFANGPWPYNVIARLLPDGTPDTSGPGALVPVTAGPGGAEVLAIATQANGRILIGGNFSTIAGENRYSLARLLPNGVLDPFFIPETNDRVDALAVQSDGLILVAGDFTKLAGANLRSVGRLTPGGLSDPTWTDCGLDGRAYALAVSGASVYAAGAFTQPHTAVVRLMGSALPRAPISAIAASGVPMVRGIPGAPLFLTVPILASAETTFTWSRPGLAPILTTRPELLFPAATSTLSGNWSIHASNATGALTWGPLQVQLAPASPGLRPVINLEATPLPVNIPTLGSVELTFAAPALSLADLRVRLDIQHSDANDLVIDLIAPDGQKIGLVGTNPGRRGSNFERTLFADDAPVSISNGAAPFRGTWQPDQFNGFSTFRRAHLAGSWRILIEDIDADSSAATVKWAALELSSPAVLPGLNATLPRGVPVLEITDSTALFRHWNAPAGSSVLTETSGDLLNWSPSPPLALRQEADQSQRHTLGLRALPAAYFRGTIR